MNRIDLLEVLKEKEQKRMLLNALKKDMLYTSRKMCINVGFESKPYYQERDGDYKGETIHVNKTIFNDYLDKEIESVNEEIKKYTQKLVDLE